MAEPAPATHWMPKPSLGESWVIFSVQPVGEVMREGESIRKLASGTSSHANQKVPTGLDALVLVSWMVYWNKLGPSWSVAIVADTVSLIGRRSGASQVRR